MLRRLNLGLEHLRILFSIVYVKFENNSYINIFFSLFKMIPIYVFITANARRPSGKTIFNAENQLNQKSFTYGKVTKYAEYNTVVFNCDKKGPARFSDESFKMGGET